MKSYLLIASIALSGALLTACSEKDDVKAPETINPNGIVLVSTPDEVISGNTATIKFRVNPSDATTLTAENIALDCTSSVVYEVEISDAESKYLGNTGAPSTGASYVQTSDAYTIVSLRPDSLGNEQLDGQYVLTIKAQDARNIIDKSSWALVYTYTTADGKQASLSSRTFAITQSPSPKNGVFAWAPQAINLRHAWGYKINDDKSNSFENTAINPVKWFVSARKYRNAATNTVVTYDYAHYIADAQVALSQGGQAIEAETEKISFEFTNDDYGYAATPDISKDPIKTVYESGADKNYITVASGLTLTDIYGNKAEWTQDVNYVIPETITFHIYFASEYVKTGKYPIYDLADALASYGINAEIIDRYPHHDSSRGAVYSADLAHHKCFASARYDEYNIFLASLIISKNETGESITPEDFCKGCFFTVRVSYYDAENAPKYKFLNFIEVIAPKE